MLVLSASQIESFDPAATFGCNRKWWFERVKKVPLPPDSNKALIIGDAVHSTIEEFLKTGQQGVLHTIALPGVQTLVNYRPRIQLIEHKIALDHDFRIAGVPIVGRIDAVAGGPPELIDWKTTSSIGKYAKTKGQLLESTQMNLYAWYLLETDFFDPGLEEMIMSLGYFGTKKREHEMVSVQTTKPKIRSCILTIEDTVSKMVTVAAESDLERIQPNEAVCNIGFGCPHRAYCPRSGSFNLPSLLDAFFSAPAPAETPVESPAVESSVTHLTPAQAAAVDAAVQKVEASGVLPPDAAPRETPVKVDEGKKKLEIVDVVSPAPATPSASSNPATPDGQITAQVGPPPEVITETPKGKGGRPKGSKNKPKEFSPPPPTAADVSAHAPAADLSQAPAQEAVVAAVPVSTGNAQSAGTAIKITRIVIRHGAKVGMPDFSSVNVEAEYEALVTGNVDRAREELSTYVKGAMIKELDLYVKKAEEQLKARAEAQAAKK